MGKNSSKDLAIVVAGGTSEPLDDVRYFTNRSGGKFGIAIFAQLEKIGMFNPGLIIAERSISLLSRTDAEKYVSGTFRSTLDLQNELSKLVHPKLIFMSAAVSDFSPKRESGKISSVPDELTVTLKKNPKLISSMRKEYGQKCFIVGFKLLSGASREELILAAKKQIKDNRINLVVANDLALITDNKHPIIVVTPEGGTIDMTGTKDEVAQQLVAFVVKRYFTRWHQSVLLDGKSTIVGDNPIPVTSHVLAKDLLSFAQQANLLIDTNGNISTRDGDSLIVTPRGVDKSKIEISDLLIAYPDPSDNYTTIYYEGNKKPSIDTGVHNRLYQELSMISGFIHFHDALVIPTAKTTFPYPCGTVEEAEEIFNAVATLPFETISSFGKSGFCVELIDHGYLIGIADKHHQYSLVKSWEVAKREYQKHLMDIGEESFVTNGKVSLKPVFYGTSIAGVLATVTESVSSIHSFSSFYLLESSRRQGLGEQFMQILSEKKYVIGVHQNCKVKDYYIAHGWHVVEEKEEMKITILRSPHDMGHTKEAATITLYNPVTKHVLIGLRLSPPFQGKLAFPGGRRNLNETPFDCALRELKEETKIHFDHRKPTYTHEVYLGDGKEIYKVTNFMFPVLNEDKYHPVETNELRAGWREIMFVVYNSPMGIGTKSLLKFLLKVLK